MSTFNQSKAEVVRKYDAFAQKFNEIYLAGTTRGRVAMSTALDQASEQLTAAGEFTTAQGDELKHFLSRDLDQTVADMRHMSEEAKIKLNPSRLAAGALSSITRVLEASSEALSKLSEKSREQLTYSTGEMTSSGTLTCSACEQTLYLKATGHVPPCPKCASTAFTKSY